MTDTQELQRKFLDFIYRNESFKSLSNEINGLFPYETLQIYRRNVWFSLIETLKLHYHSVLQLLGEDRFSEFARIYVMDNPSTTPDLELYGWDFPLFLEKQNIQPEYIIDIATIDISRVKVAISHNYKHKSFADFLSINSEDYERTIFSPNPTTLISDLSYDVLDFFLDINEKSNINHIIKKQSNIIAISRHPNHKIHCVKISELEKSFLQLCHKRKNLFEIFSELHGNIGFDFKNILNNLINTNLITSYDICQLQKCQRNQPMKAHKNNKPENIHMNTRICCNI